MSLASKKNFLVFALDFGYARISDGAGRGSQGWCTPFFRDLTPQPAQWVPLWY